jgi:hypothetical protein
MNVDNKVPACQPARVRTPQQQHGGKLITAVRGWDISQTFDECSEMLAQE